MAEPRDDNYVFKIIQKSTGAEWRVYADGRIAGFPDDVIIVNRIEGTIREAIRKYERGVF